MTAASQRTEVRFITCYPDGPGGKRPCGAVAHRRSSLLQELICPGLPEAACRELTALWNETRGETVPLRDLEAELTRFLTERLTEGRTF